MSDPLVSILVPTYNGERFLRAALRSATEQSHRDVEILVGDDASTDRTPEIAAAAAAADPRVRVIRHETNVGAFENPKLLVAAARGDYVKFLLHDDVLAKDCVRTLLRGLQASPGATMAFSRRNLVDEDGRPLPGGVLQPLRDRPGLVEGRELGEACLSSGNNLVGELTTVLFRRDVVELDEYWQVDGRKLDVLGDLALWLRLLGHGPAFYSPEALSRFRMHGDQRSQNPRVVSRGIRDWPRLLDWAVRHGFLVDSARQRQAYAQVLHGATARVAQLVEGQEYGAALEAVFLCTTRLAELGSGGPEVPVTPLSVRAHGPAAHELLDRELDVRFTALPVAVAAVPTEAVDRGLGTDIADAVTAFRDVEAAGTANRFVLAVLPSRWAEATELLALARSAGPDVDVELVPTDAPATVIRDAWLAVATRGSSWHGGMADALWEFDPTRVVQGVPSSVAS